MFTETPASGISTPFSSIFTTIFFFGILLQGALVVVGVVLVEGVVAVVVGTSDEVDVL